LIRRGGFIVGTFEFDGEKYKTASAHQKEWGNDLISQLSLNGNEVILDLGCGDGILTGQLALLVPEGKAVGIDASAGMIETAKKIERSNLGFVRMDISKMEIKDEFDVIFSNAALHWIKDHNRLLKASYQALKTHGILLWDFGSNGNCSNFLNVINKKIIEDKYMDFFKDFEFPWYMPSKKQYEELVQATGFSKFIITEVNKDRYFKNADEMIRWIDQPCIVPFIKCLPDRLKDTFRKEVIEEMVCRTQQADGTCFETFRRLNVYAEKNKSG